MLRRQAHERSVSQQAAEMASQRLLEARAKAAEAEKERLADNQKLLEEAARQRQLAERARAAERKAYEAREAELQAELERRAAAEKEVRAERLAAQRAVEDQIRREAEKAKMQREKERERERQEMLLAQQQEREKKAAERREIQRLSTKFTVALEGSAIVSIPPEGTETQGRLPREALLMLEVGIGSLVGGSSVYGPVAFESVEAAQNQLSFQLCSAAYQGANGFAAAARLRRMTDEGPLTKMLEPELTYWMRCTSVRTALAAEAGVEKLLQQFKGRRAQLSHKFESRTSRGVLPEADPRRTEAVLRRAVSAIEADNLGSAREILEVFLADEAELLIQDMVDTIVTRHVAAVLAAAFFLEFMWAERPSKRVEASPWFETASRLACTLVAEALKNAPQDSLREVANLVAAVVPRDNVIARQMERLALENESPQTQARVRQQEELLQAELAERLVEYEWPDRSELAAARQADVEAKTPIPERIWALKNVGATLALGGSGERRRARQLLERAVTLKRELVGSRKHPGMLPEFDALAKILESEPEWERDALSLRAVILAALAMIAEAYVQAGDTASAVILLEASVKEYEELLGLRQAEVVSASKRANGLFETLSDQDKAAVTASRRKSGVVANVIEKFQEEVASRQAPGAQQRFEAWNERGVEWLRPLR